MPNDYACTVCIYIGIYIEICIDDALMIIVRNNSLAHTTRMMKVKSL